MFETTDWLAPQLPADKPRYFMGIGDPEGILETIEAGVDMFDCVLPTRTARTGSALTWEGRLNLRNARFARDPGAARRRLRLPRVHDLLTGLHPAPREPGGAPRAPAPLAPQSTLRPRADPPGARGDRAGEFDSYKRDALERLSDWRAPHGNPDRHRRPRRRRVASARAPGRRRQRAHAAMQDDVAVGDEIITAGGMHAIVREAGERELRIEIAPGVVVTLDRRAVAAVAQEIQLYNEIQTETTRRS